ncbi:TonB-dependent receptor [Phenylobacterium sp.]|uniref:TonB-dependent receptor n=1 Tax=Phenylobacterium sp. TaxID=1871053 RepID=UPI002722521C|nr:TonB-dependent receptor [Phenylobacterium sp.]MDO8798936.1 TonB-dependent receptor [Phenylobacterium sp.]
MNGIFQRALLSTLLSSVATVSLAATDTAPAPGAPSAADSASDAADAAPEVDGITVTARRREEDLQDVPLAVSVTTAAKLDQTGTSSIVQLTQLVPTLQVLSPNARNTALTIRGLGASYGLANDGLEQGVGVYVDQVYNSRPAIATLDFMDIQQVEVLRGPQGTLFGKNTTAGALNVTTVDASNAFGGRVEASYGSYNYLQAKATVTGPIIKDLVAGRLSFVGAWRDGNLYNPVQKLDQNALESKGVRGQLLFTPTENLKVRLTGDYSSQQPECCTQLYVTVGTTLKPANQQYPALAAGKNYRPPSTNPYDRLADVDDAIQADQWLSGVSAVVDYDLGWATLTSVSAHREWDWEPRNDRDYTALDVTRRSNNPSHQKQTSQEFRLTSNGARTLDWTAGLYYFEQNVTTHGVTEYGSDAAYWLLPATNSPASLLEGYTVFNNSTIDTTSYAAFGQLTWNISERLRVTPGLRYTQEKKDGSYVQTTSGGSVTTDTTLINRRLGIARPQAFSASTDDGSWSGQLAVAYDLDTNLHAYGTYSRGYKSGGINMTALPLTSANLPSLAAAVIEPEQVSTFELGLKSELFDRLVTANFAVFTTQVNDFQANVVDSGPGALRGYLANVERVEIKGAELDLSTRSVGGFTSYLNLALTDGKYDSFKNGPCPLERIGASTAACDLSGKELPGLSRWAGAFGGEYRRSTSFGSLAGDAYAGVDASFRSAYFADTADSIYTRISAYQIINLRAGFKAEGGWEAFVTVKNAFNEDYLQNITVVSGNSGLVVGTPGDDRTVNFTVRASF